MQASTLQLGARSVLLAHPQCHHEPCLPCVARHQAPLIQRLQHQADARCAQSLPDHSRRDRVECRSSAAAMNDPADIIPSPYDDEDEEDPGRVVPSTQHVVVVGAGPAGLLTSMYLARRGYNVQVYEREPAPEVACSSRQPNYPMVLSSRALIAFRELKLDNAYYGPSAPLHLGTWDVVSGVLQPGNTQDENQRTLLADRQGLTAALAAETRRLFPDKIRLHYDCELQGLDIPGRQAILACAQPASSGATLLCAADRSAPGAALSAAGTRPPPSPSPSIPSWDAAALAAAAGPSAPRVGGSMRRVPYDLLVGADGADSRMRRLMLRAKPKVREFEIQQPNVDGETFRPLAGLDQAAAPALVPGFASHRPREYLYVLAAPAPGGPRLEMWVSEPGVVSGILVAPPGFPWGEPGAVRAALLGAGFGAALPAAWVDGVVAQACAAGAPPPRSTGRTVQCSQFHGPKMVLLGDAAHTMTTQTRQGLNCAVESVRLFNVVLKISGDNLARVGNILTEVRGEDAHCAQMIEGMQRRLRPGLVHGDATFAAAAWLSGVIWRAAALMAALVNAVAPGAGFHAAWVREGLSDCRRGYSEVLKLLTRFAALPILALLGATAVLLRGPIMTMVRAL